MSGESTEFPKTHQQFLDQWRQQKQARLDAYAQRRTSFVALLLPEEAVRLRAAETLEILRRRLGEALDLALEFSEPDGAARPLPAAIRSPVADQPDGQWLKTSNMVGINVRTVGSFWNLVKYALTLPQAQDSIHVLPIWEPGVVGSLYGMSSWCINTEFFSRELAAVQPELDTVERQLRFAIHLLHAMGKAVGMDVIPHTDRYSEMALAHPEFFEWLQREGTEIVDHRENLHEAVQACIVDFLAAHGPAMAGDDLVHPASTLFAASTAEATRLRLLFGPPEDRRGRDDRRNQLVKHLHDRGYEPAPATMAPPYRGLEVDPGSRVVDSQGNSWYDYRITHPQPMSRVFSPLARYKLYGALDDNAKWEIDFARPRPEVWRYVCEKYYEVQSRYRFDFMRGDMSHVQMRPGGVPAALDEYYDLLRAVKNTIQKEQGVHHFGYFAETFLAGRDVMLYGDEVDHLEAVEAEVTLGDLQSTVLGSADFLQRLRWYHDLIKTRSFAPSFGVMTGDKDDPRFDRFYLQGNALRLFLALFVTDMPSYVALGFETREPHHVPAANEQYTKLYVFQESAGPKATAGPYVWGKNGALFGTITRLRLYADQVLPAIRGRPTRWLIPPDATGSNKHLAWTQDGGEPCFLFVANTNTEEPVENVTVPRLPRLEPNHSLTLDLTTETTVAAADRRLFATGRGYKVWHLAPGEGRVYRVTPIPPARGPEGE